eukprot:TRINITY_DN36329_c0_g2_i1.p1 TRINITY_DN36329_c0_g2~~TRINITY_DN36329_c0_g2_i1.p1  ORF type:complete len:653 (-),score=158.92 TRINITY_DN36329_c0_g2_i1:97-2055(-)
MVRTSQGRGSRGSIGGGSDAAGADAAGAQEKKGGPKNKPSVLAQVRPQNVEAEMQRFFASGCTEAPQFEYRRQSLSRQAYDSHCSVDFLLLPVARRILDEALERYGSPSDYFKAAFGDDAVGPKELGKEASLYLRRLGLEGRVDLKLRNCQLSLAEVSKPARHAKHVVTLATNTQVPRKMLMSILDHEMGTHLLRMMNDEQQVWYGRRAQHGLQRHLATEEGLAALNSLLALDVKYLWGAAVNYFAVCMGHQMGFVELFRELEPYMSCPKKRFRGCVRVKRGLMDTSQQGAFNVDQSYLTGAVQILRALEHVDFPLLYCGQMALEDMNRLRFRARRTMLHLPGFLATEEKAQQYRQDLLKMRSVNRIPPGVLPSPRMRVVLAAAPAPAVRRKSSVVVSKGQGKTSTAASTTIEAAASGAVATAASKSSISASTSCLGATGPAVAPAKTVGARFSAGAAAPVRTSVLSRRGSVSSNCAMRKSKMSHGRRTSLLSNKGVGCHGGRRPSLLSNKSAGVSGSQRISKAGIAFKAALDAIRSGGKTPTAGAAAAGTTAAKTSNSVSKAAAITAKKAAPTGAKKTASAKAASRKAGGQKSVARKKASGAGSAVARKLSKPQGAASSSSMSKPQSQTVSKPPPAAGGGNGARRKVQGHS